MLMRVTTTHDQDGSGAPRLVLEKQDQWVGEGQDVFPLGQDDVTIGSADDCDVVLPDLAPHHATVVHTSEDEYLIASLGPETRVHGAVVTNSAVLRTGARIEVGPYALAYTREEYADHGRPYGGREGGEIDHQRPQPPRPRDHGRPTGS
jgi:hypothetical protein